jgi:hypothetical protein
MKNTSIIMQKALYIISFAAGLIAILGRIELEIMPKKHNHIIPGTILIISALVGLGGFVEVALFKKSNKDILRWLGLIGAILASISFLEY